MLKSVSTVKLIKLVKYTSFHLMSQLRAESMAAKRQSAALLTNISGDQKLMKALIDIEELTTKYETDKQTYESKVVFS